MCKCISVAVQECISAGVGVLMRKIGIFLFLLLSAISSSYAAPCYGTKMPKAKEFFLGVQNYTIFKRYLEGDFGKIRSTQDFLLLSYGVFDWLSLDLKGGAGNIKQHPVGSDEIDYPSAFNGGYGFRLKVYDSDRIKSAFGFQHISVHPQEINIGEIKHESILDDWQFSFLASSVFAKITPYIGTKWSRADYIHRVDDNRKRRMSDLRKSIGLVLGLDLPIANKMWINLEGQFLDSEAFAFSLNYGF